MRVSARAFARITPSTSTTPPATLVPPMSIPIVYAALTPAPGVARRPSARAEGLGPAVGREATQPLADQVDDIGDLVQCLRTDRLDNIEDPADWADAAYRVTGRRGMRVVPTLGTGVGCRCLPRGPGSGGEKVRLRHTGGEHPQQARGFLGDRADPVAPLDRHNQPSTRFLSSLSAASTICCSALRLSIPSMGMLRSTAKR